MTKLCRLCLTKLEDYTEFFNLNTVEVNSGFMPFRDQVQTCIPEIALDLIPNPIICGFCQSKLRQSYEFKKQCLDVEDRIRFHIANQPLGEEYDLTALAKIKREKREIKIKREQNEDEHNDDLQVLVKTEILEPEQTFKGLEIVPKIKRRRKKKNYYLSLQNSLTPYFCNYKNCKKSFDTKIQLNCHKMIHPQYNHYNDYKCNFCNSPFTSLQLLRRHNSQCTMKILVTPPLEKNNLKKRPQLPNKAKCFLKRWLYKHTDRPYPTDLEKQELMKETNLTLMQVENWFINARRRILQNLTSLKKESKIPEDYLELESGLDESQSSQNVEEVIVKEEIQEIEENSLSAFNDQ